MKRFAILSIALAAASMSHAAEIYNNGPVAGADGRSAIGPGLSTFGYNMNTAANSAVTDDFVIEAGSRWTLSSIDFFGYQTGATAFTLQQATWSIVEASPNASVVLASGTTGLSNGGIAGYRVSDDWGSTARAIYRAQADVADFSLEAGHYYLRWSLAGSDSVTGPWQPPVADWRTGNAGQSSDGGDFLKFDDSSELPFALHGTVSAVPEPATYGMMLAGLAMVGAMARRRKQA